MFTLSGAFGGIVVEIEVVEIALTEVVGIVLVAGIVVVVLFENIVVGTVVPGLIVVVVEMVVVVVTPNSASKNWISCCKNEGCGDAAGGRCATGVGAVRQSCRSKRSAPHRIQKQYRSKKDCCNIKFIVWRHSIHHILIFNKSLTMKIIKHFFFDDRITTIIHTCATEVKPCSFLLRSNW